ncbi:low molecular weight protein-tyrosine-phosphatase [Leucobacter tenebrionis]|uniref:low molecular weight protein-tyrosine-phosphatase n=1 Tax=Leucobacter tenebrionis TaxID=2873270 RepID=UPI001CA6A61C|nr:low molecular weight protein-tyrosine-phosphatase [Leucobacter tenebrionis]QZY50815.1 low molecular weight phosphotyrosine protein phosphatase [Leucobacter tenebrionis]
MNTADPIRPFHVSFVCSGNICRSPMGEVIFRAMAEQAGVAERFVVTSRGTHGYHVGEPADPRTLTALAAAGYDGSAHRAAQVSPADIADHDLLIALDRGHERRLRELGADPERLSLLTVHDPARPGDPDVFDPYYSDQHAFHQVLEQIERSCTALLEHLTRRA